MYKVFPHVAVVEDLSFLSNEGGQGGLPNQKRRRDLLVWRYGEPESQGEARGRRDADRRRDMHRRRDDDDDNDH